MEQGIPWQGCETITADLGLRGVVLEAKYCIVVTVVLVFDAVCDLDIFILIFMNDNAYATDIITVQKCHVNKYHTFIFDARLRAIARGSLYCTGSL